MPTYTTVTGEDVEVEEVGGVMVPVNAAPSLDEQVAELQATVTAQSAALVALLAQLEG